MADESEHIPLARKVVLPYRSAALAATTPVVKVGAFLDLLDAQLHANELAGHDIEYFLANQNVMSLGFPYSGFSQIELQVRAEDKEKALAILSTFQANPLEVEPADPIDPNEPIDDPGGEGSLVTAVAFDNPRALLDAAAVLGAARIDCFVPALAARKDRPAGEGKRFALRVRSDDLERAGEVLADAEENEEGEPRCPKCGSYRVERAGKPWPGIVRFLIGGGPRSEPQMECLRCKHRWSQTNSM